MISRKLTSQYVDPVTRFWARVEKSISCWLWVGAKEADGYGRFDIEHKHIRAHRFSWILHNGPVPNGLGILHRCNNTSCVNPSHLYAGTPKDNALDTVNSGNTTTGVKNGNSKLNNEAVRAIRNDQRCQRVIAKEHDISAQTVCTIKKGRTWKHLL